MATKITRDWRELFDIALFEPNRTKLRTCIDHAKRAIRSRLDALLTEQGENETIMPERIALSDALTTLADLHKIVYARKPGASVGREDASNQAGPQ